MEEKTVLAKVIKLDDGIHVVGADGNIGPVCTRVTTDGYYYLSENAANRKFINKKSTDAYFVENPDGEIALYYKESRHFDTSTPKLPNAKLIAFLSEEDQAEYKAIVDRAIEARNAAIAEAKALAAANKKRPLTDEEKLQRKIAKLQAQIAALQNVASEANTDPIVEE